MSDDATWSPGGEPPPDAPPPVGERYRDEGPLARGGMGEVRRAWDLKLGIPVAMKVLAWALYDDAGARARFAAEAATTARLQHPGVVAVYDHGELPDGRPWFTMSLVEGQTFEDIIRAAAPPAGPDTLRRLVGILHRAAETVGYAHRRGVVHRDLKPSNVMVGAFGEVRVMDWGLARWEGAAEAGGVVGTPTFMAPEQARGEPAGPAADVYALGGILHLLLTGQPRLAGPPQAVWRQLLRELPPVLPAPRPDIPEELRMLCVRALAADPGARFGDARELAEALEAWLDGAQRRAEALELVARARAGIPGLHERRARVAALREEAAAALARVDPLGPVDAKAAAWALQDEAARLETELALAEVTWTQELRAALTRAPDLPEADALLADHYREGLERAEAARDPVAVTRAEALLRAHDRGRHEAYLSGDGALTLHTDRPAVARLWRYVERGRRRVAEPIRELGTTPLVDVPLAPGSWLLTLHPEDGPVVRYPVWMERAGRWDGVPPEGGPPTPVHLPRTLRDDEVYVPGGWCLLGGDADAAESLPLRRFWIDGFALRRHPVTTGEYLAFLNALVARGEGALAEALCPSEPQAADVPLLARDAEGRFLPGVDSGGRTWGRDTPVALVTWRAAMAYAAWRAGQDGVAWRLPHDLEWEKAARGVDRRFFPWGDHLEAAWANIAAAGRGPLTWVDVDAFPADESPYGARGLAGNVRDWCGNAYSAHGPPAGRVDVAAEPEAAFRMVRGGAFTSTPRVCRAAVRFANRPDERLHTVGLRLARSVG